LKKKVMNRLPKQNEMFDLSPAEIKQKIRTAFYTHARRDSEKISVNANGNVVQLTGTVRSWTERKDAADAAWAIPGVTEVKKGLAVEGEIYTGE
jgi:osmotically-inducible protein OsmY